MPSELGKPEEFSFDVIKRKARSLAEASYAPPRPIDTEILDKIDYDAYQDIRYRKDRTLRLDDADTYPIQLFHLGRLARDPVRISIVTDGYARDVIYQSDLFDFSKDQSSVRALE